MLGIALMQLDSVRSLKQDIVSTVLPKLVERLPTAHSYGLPAAPIPKVEENPRALALGISPEGNGFKLAVRIQHRGLLQQPIASDRKTSERRDRCSLHWSCSHPSR